MTELRIPSHAVRNQSAKLECYFDLDGETLYSVKWYKDGNEFYRYVPRDMPPVQVFPLSGVTVDVSNFIKFPASFLERFYLIQRVRSAYEAHKMLRYLQVLQESLLIFND